MVRELVRDLVEATGKSCVACGNYGVPLSEVVLYENVPQVIALELSSFQLETIVDFKPDAVIWLNFSPDHMDRYQSVEDYRAAKLRILENIDEKTPVVVRAGEDLPARGRVITFSSEQPADWSLRTDDVCCDEEKFVAMSETRLRGLHNAENIMAACAVLPGLSPDLASRALSLYTPPEHRCELVDTIDEVEYLNDSKATNLHALESALRSQIRPTILIAGGKEKGLDYQALVPVLAKRAKHLICFGQIGAALAAIFSKIVPCDVVETLDEAVALAAGLSIPGDAVLLSPGTSSFDQFKSYEARGSAFKAAVSQISPSF